MHAYNSWHVYTLCICMIGMWLHYYGTEEESHQKTSYCISTPYQPAYRDLPRSLQKKICTRAQNLQYLFYNDVASQRAAIIHIFLTGGYQHKHIEI